MVGAIQILAIVIMIKMMILITFFVWDSGDGIQVLRHTRQMLYH